MIRGSKSIHKYYAVSGGGCCQLHAVLPAAIIHSVAAIENYNKTACTFMERYRANLHERFHEQPVFL